MVEYDSIYTGVCTLCIVQSGQNSLVTMMNCDSVLSEVRNTINNGTALAEKTVIAKDYS